MSNILKDFEKWIIILRDRKELDIDTLVKETVTWLRIAKHTIAKFKKELDKHNK